MRKTAHVDERTTRSSGFYCTPSRLYFNEVGTKLMHLRDLTRQSVAVFVEGNQPLNLGILVLFLLATTLPHVSTFSILWFARTQSCDSFK